MRLDYLKYLIAIKEYGSINKAAGHLFMSQQNLSKMIKRLEDEFGYKIFEKHTRKNTFTEEGERLYQYALQYEARNKALLNRLTETSLKNMNGIVRIGTMSTGATMILPQILASYYKNYPNITLQITDGLLANLTERLLNNEIDMAIVLVAQINGRDCERFPEEIQKDLLIETNNCCWVSTKNPLSKRQKITIEEMVQYPAIVNARSDVQMMRKLYETYGGNLRIVIENENPYILSKFTADDFGLFPDVAVFDNHWMMKYAFGGRNDVVAVPVAKENGYGSKMYLLTSCHQNYTALTRHVINYIKGENWRIGGAQ